MKRFKNILFIADRDDSLQAALQRAVSLAKTNKARLTVMDVAPDAGLADYFRRSYGIDFNKQLREQRLESLEAITRPYNDAGIAVYTTVATGTTFIEVIRAVQRNQHDLVIKVAEHSAGLSVALFGSTDMHLLRKCPCPVWIDAPTSTGDYKKVLAAVDPFDDASGDLQRLILDLATSLAAREQAELEVVHAWELPGESILTHGRGRLPLHEVEAMLKDRKEHHQRSLDALLLPYGLSRGEGNIHLRKGHPARVITACARECEADLIVMGTLGRVSIPGLIIGNTAEDVLREMQTAVLAVKPGGFVSPIVK